MKTTFPRRPVYRVPLPKERTLVLGERPLVMGILNVTPDSFAEAAALVSAGAAVDAGMRLEAEGADIIDVGGESTRPGAAAVSEDEELSRVIPVVRGLAARARVPISIDTTKSGVAQAALAEGASIVNDISGLQFNPAIGDAVRERRAAIVLMHMRGRPQSMYAAADYTDLVGDVIRELQAAVESARRAGIPQDAVIVDPGIGFAKHASHSYGVLARLGDIAAALERPLLVGPSGKSFLREALEGRPAVERDWGTAAAVTASVLGGAHIVRVHAVAAMAQVVRVAEEIRRHALSVETR